MISVALISYNQKKYIVEAIEGALNQQDVDIEIIIGDDFSTDGTQEVIEGFARKHPAKIKVSTRDGNLGMHDNWEKTISECTGDYVAILEGDDKWDDPLKLKKQLQLLKQNPKSVACFSNARVLKDNGTYSTYNYVDKEHFDLEAEYFFKLNANPIPTCTTVFKTSAFKGFPPEYHNSPFADWVLHSLLIQKGKYVYLEHCTSTYRQHGNGVWSGIDKERQLLNKLKAIKIISGLVEEKYRNSVKVSLYKQLDDLLYFYQDSGDRIKYFRTWLQLKLT